MATNVAKHRHRTLYASWELSLVDCNVIALFWSVNLADDLTCRCQRLNVPAWNRRISQICRVRKQILGVTGNVSHKVTSVLLPHLKWMEVQSWLQRGWARLPDLPCRAFPLSGAQYQWSMLAPLLLSQILSLPGLLHLGLSSVCVGVLWSEPHSAFACLINLIFTSPCWLKLSWHI